MVHTPSPGIAGSEPGDDPEALAGQEIRRLRVARKWTQEEVTRRMKAYGYDFHQTMIAKIEAAQRPLRVRELADFAAMFGVAPHELLYPRPDASSAEDLMEQADALGRAREQAAAAEQESRRSFLAAASTYMDAQREREKIDARLDLVLGRLAADEAYADFVTARAIRSYPDAAPDPDREAFIAASAAYADAQEMAT
jgi:transcriptional regulator with XRE-family HTH domain